MLTIYTHSFTADSKQTEAAVKYGWTDGTIEVALLNDTRRVPATRKNDGSYSVWGLGFRFRTGTKVWHSGVYCKADGTIDWSVPLFDNRSGRYSRPMIVGFWEEIPEQHRSKR